MRYDVATFMRAGSRPTNQINAPKPAKRAAGTHQVTWPETAGATQHRPEPAGATAGG